MRGLGQVHRGLVEDVLRKCRVVEDQATIEEKGEAAIGVHKDRGGPGLLWREISCPTIRCLGNFKIRAFMAIESVDLLRLRSAMSAPWNEDDWLDRGGLDWPLKICLR